MLEYEKAIFEKNFCLIAGCDEAGRGPLCGPLVVSAVILPKHYKNEAINDSKKLKEKDRERLFEEIIHNALAYSIVILEPKEIDELNIYEASRVGMCRAIRALKLTPDYILTDAMPLYDFILTPQEALIKGDAKAQCIAAASILAKVTRDRIMKDVATQYPEYQFEKHKGYPTPFHLRILKEKGPIQGLYRYSYRPVKEATEKTFS